MSAIDLERDLVVTLSSGDENNPGSVRGLVLVTITADAVRVENRRVGRVRKWEARPRPELLPTLRARLREAGFPEVPLEGLPPAGATFRILRVDSGDATASVMIPTNSARKLRVWSRVFKLLDAIAVQASRGELDLGPVDAALLVET